VQQAVPVFESVVKHDAELEEDIGIASSLLHEPRHLLGLSSAGIVSQLSGL
jgi:hypothetical protein